MSRSSSPRRKTPRHRRTQSLRKKSRHDWRRHQRCSSPRDRRRFHRHERRLRHRQRNRRHHSLFRQFSRAHLASKIERKTFRTHPFQLPIHRRLQQFPPPQRTRWNPCARHFRALAQRFHHGNLRSQHDAASPQIIFSFGHSRIQCGRAPALSF